MRSQRLLPLLLLSTACAPDADRAAGTTARALVPGPDLVVTAISAPPSASGNFTAQVTVCNHGQDPAPSGPVELYASVDELIVGGPPPAGDPLVGADWVTSLASTECQTIAVNAWAPPIQGAAYLGAIVDPYQQLAEGDETNNVFVGGLMGFGWGPDLVVAAIDGPPSADGGFTVEVRLCNQGTSWSSGAVVELFATTDLLVDPMTDFLVGSWWFSGVDAGQCQSVSFTAWAPPLQGAAYLAARVDGMQSVPELIETNNDTVGELMGFGWGPDLVVTAISAPVAIDGAFTALITVCNQGTGDASGANVELYASPDPLLDPGPPPGGDFMVGSVWTGWIPAGQCAPTPVQAWSPPFTGEGYLGAAVDPQDQQLELIESNNTHVGGVTGFGSGPDLVVSSIDAPAAVDGAFTATLRVCNQGTAPAPGGNVDLYATADEVLVPGPPPAGDLLVGTTWFGSLQVTQCQDVQVMGWAPPIPGGGHLAALVDPQDTVVELIESNDVTVGPLMGFGAGPELIIATLTPPSAADGPFVVDVELCNQGNVWVGGVTVDLYASSDTTLDVGPPPSGDFFAGTTWVDSLQPGQCRHASANAWTPPFTGAGYLIGSVDPYAQVPELVESNNLRVSGVMGFGNGPDLVVTAITAPYSANGQFQAQITVCNVGTNDVPASTVELYATVDQVLQQGPPPFGDTLVGTGMADALVHGQCAVVSVNAWTPPLQGAAFLVAVADPWSQHAELVESNNTTLGPQVGFGYGPNLVVTAIDGPAAADGNFTADVTVCNRGTTDAPSAALELYGTQDATLELGPPPVGDFVLGFATTSWLLAGQCQTVEVTAWSPPFTGEGRLAAVIDRAAQIGELIESDNTWVDDVMGFGYGPDLVIDAIAQPPAAEGAFSATFTVCNQGTGDSWGHTLAVYASSDAHLDAGPGGDQQVGSQWVPNLYAGQCAPVTVDLWGSVLQGEGRLIGVVDPYAQVTELVESNNTRVGGVMGFGSGPELVVTAISAPASIDGAFDASATVCNQGTAPSPSVTVELYATVDTTVVRLPSPSADFLVGVLNAAPLAAGECRTEAVGAWGPPLTGEAHLAAVTDPYGAIAELVESNNVFVGPVHGFGLGPDLVATQISAPPSASSNFSVEVTVCNQGTQDAPATPLELYASADQVLDTAFPPPAGDFLVGVGTVDPLLVGQCRAVAVQAWTPPLMGETYLAARVDPQSQLVELVESNDVTFDDRSIGFGYGPDLVVTAVSGPAASSGAFDARVTVCNQGTASAPSVNVELYGSSDAIIQPGPPSLGDVLIGSGTTIPLLPEQCQVLLVPASTPPFTGSGYVGAVVDPFAQAAELIESNNTGVSGVVGFGTGPELVIGAITVPSSANASFAVGVTVCNQGTSSAPTAQLDVFASADTALLLPGDFPVVSTAVAPLAVGACQTLPLTAALPPMTGAGYVIAAVDRGGAIAELVEANNTRVSASLGFGAGPDLVVTTVSGPTSVNSGSYVVQVTVCNRGTTSAPSAAIELYGTTDTTVTRLPSPLADPLLGVANTATLNAGACATVPVTSGLPPFSGAAYFGAVVDPWSSIAELIESNNTTLSALTGFGAGPDLRVELLDADPFVRPSSVIALDYRVCNRGTLSAPATTMAVLASAVPSPSPNVPPQMPVPIGPLAVGQCVSGASSVYVSGDVPLGPAYLVAWADFGNGVPELVEANNTASDGFTVANAYCGDGVLMTGEACDDGNFDGGDGCSATCTVEYHNVWQERAYGTLISNVSWQYAMGYHFTPNVNGYITALGGYFNGTKTVRLFDRTSGALLAQANVTATNGWGQTAIAPLAVTAGRRYTVAVYLAGSGGSYRTGVTFPATYGDVRIDGSTYVYTLSAPMARPTNTVTTVMYGQADVRFSRYP